MESSSECRESDIFPNRVLLCPDYPDHRIMHQLGRSDFTKGSFQYGFRPCVSFPVVDMRDL